jgi:hypothetical protein
MLTKLLETVSVGGSPAFPGNPYSRNCPPPQPAPPPVPPPGSLPAGSAVYFQVNSSVLVEPVVYNPRNTAVQKTGMVIAYYTVTVLNASRQQTALINVQPIVMGYYFSDGSFQTNSAAFLQIISQLPTPEDYTGAEAPPLTCIGLNSSNQPILVSG